MLRNYLVVALRNIARHKSYAFINIAGLSIGLACCFLIVLFVRHELSYDRFHTNADRLYRLLHVDAEDAASRSAVSASGYAPHLLQSFPEIEAAVRLDDRSGATFRYEGETYQGNDLAFADGEILQAFSFPLAQGNPATALEEPATMVLTAEAARALFGTADAVGRTVGYVQGSRTVDLRVTGILEEVPSHSHVRFDYLVSFETLRELRGPNALEDYVDFNYFTYVLLQEGVDPAQVEARFPAFLRAHRGEEAAQNNRLALQPLTEIHLTKDIRWDVDTNTDPRTLYIFSGIAVLILLIASINFMNLSTARATLRAREVGVRKAVGAQRGQLVRQFFSESILASVVALVLAFGLTLLFRPALGDLLGRELTLSPVEDIGLLLLLVGIGLLTGLMAGIYPAAVLSAFNPTKVLKGEVTRGTKGRRLREGLIVVQFGITIVLLLAVVTVYNQLHFMKSRDLGFDKEQVVFLSLSGPVKDGFDAFRQSLLTNPSVQEVSLAGNLPGRVSTMRGYNWPGTEDEEEQGRGLYSMFADPHYLETMGLELAAGRDFSEDIATDVQSGYILNETAVRELGLEEPVGHPFRVWDREMGQVIGVVKDFHFKSLHQQIEPVVLYMHPEWSWNAAVRIAGTDVPGTLDFIRARWEAMDPAVAFTYQFLDEDFDRLYRQEERLGQLFSYFAYLSILVACLGLFGLISFVAEQRRKEIGVRKVLGASVGQVVFLLSREFGVLVLVAAVLASPVAYFAMQGWLDGFAYRIGLGPGPFLLVAALALGLALLTVSYQAVKAALTDPAKVLRYE